MKNEEVLTGLAWSKSASTLSLADVHVDSSVKNTYVAPPSQDAGVCQAAYALIAFQLLCL